MLFLKVVVLQSCLQHAFLRSSVHGEHRLTSKIGFVERFTLELTIFLEPSISKRLRFLLNAIKGRSSKIGANSGSRLSKFQFVFRTSFRFGSVLLNVVTMVALLLPFFCLS